jgi:hypothetical protein
MVAAEYRQKLAQCTDMRFSLDPVQLALAFDSLQVQQDKASRARLILRFRKICCSVPSRLLHFIPWRFRIMQ